MNLQAAANLERQALCMYAGAGFKTGTQAAAAGGVTAVIDMPLNNVPATTTGDLVGNELTRRSVHVQHVVVDASDLGIEVGPYRGAGSDVRLHYVSDHLDRLAIFQDSRVRIGLLYYRVPGLVGERHEVLNKSILLSLLTLC